MDLGARKRLNQDQVRWILQRKYLFGSMASCWIGLQEFSKWSCSEDFLVLVDHHTMTLLLRLISKQSNATQWHLRLYFERYLIFTEFIVAGLLFIAEIVIFFQSRWYGKLIVWDTYIPCTSHKPIRFIVSAHKKISVSYKYNVRKSIRQT